MRIYLDTANMEQIRQAAKLGVVSGITTNPTLVSKEGHSDYRAAVLKIRSLIDGPISAEVLSQEVTDIVKEARQISSWAKDIVVKVPMTAAGLEAISVLAKEGIKINMTLCFSVNQALLGALAGAAYVSSFVGRLDDIGWGGMALVADIVELFKRYSFDTQVIAASIRHPLHCIAAAKAGADIATVPYSVLMQMIRHPLTDVGVERFLNDWRQVAKG